MINFLRNMCLVSRNDIDSLVRFFNALADVVSEFYSIIIIIFKILISRKNFFKLIFNGNFDIKGRSCTERRN